MTSRLSQEIGPPPEYEAKTASDEKTVHDEKPGAAAAARPSTAGTGGRGALNIVENPLRVRAETGSFPRASSMSCSSWNHY